MDTHMVPPSRNPSEGGQVQPKVPLSVSLLPVRNTDAFAYGTKFLSWRTVHFRWNCDRFDYSRDVRGDAGIDDFKCFDSMDG